MRKIRATANRGKTYDVEFDDAGDMVSVAVIFRRGCDYSSHARQVWHRRSGREPSITVKCAGRAAAKEIENAQVA